MGLFEAFTYSNLIKLSTDVQAQTALMVGAVREAKGCRYCENGT